MLGRIDEFLGGKYDRFPKLARAYLIIVALSWIGLVIATLYFEFIAVMSNPWRSLRGGEAVGAFLGGALTVGFVSPYLFLVGATVAGQVALAAHNAGFKAWPWHLCLLGFTIFALWRASVHLPQKFKRRSRREKPAPWWAIVTATLVGGGIIAFWAWSFYGE